VHGGLPREPDQISGMPMNKLLEKIDISKKSISVLRSAILEIIKHAQFRGLAIQVRGTVAG
jgi:hypothetical protein